MQKHLLSVHKKNVGILVQKHKIKRQYDTLNNGMVNEMDKSLEDSALEGKENKEKENYVYECPACKTVLSTKGSKFYHKKVNGPVL